MFAFGPPPPRRRPGLTPMVDVIFLLVVFFMLAARFGAEAVQPVALAGEGWQGPPRLVEVLPEGLRLNGAPVAAADLPAGLAALGAGPGDPVVLRAAGDARLQRVVDVMQSLSAAGFARLVLVEWRGGVRPRPCTPAAPRGRGAHGQRGLPAARLFPDDRHHRPARAGRSDPPEGRGPAAAAAADALWLAADGTVAFGELRGSVAVAAAAASGGPVELRADAGASPADPARLLAALAAAGAPGAALVLREAP